MEPLKEEVKKNELEKFEFNLTNIFSEAKLKEINQEDIEITGARKKKEPVMHFGGTASSILGKPLTADQQLAKGVRLACCSLSPQGANKTQQ
jgi:hypothetical protein